VRGAGGFRTNIYLGSSETARMNPIGVDPSLQQKEKKRGVGGPGEALKRGLSIDIFYTRSKGFESMRPKGNNIHYQKNTKSRT